MAGEDIVTVKMNFSSERGWVVVVEVTVVIGPSQIEAIVAIVPDGGMREVSKMVYVTNRTCMWVPCLVGFHNWEQGCRS